MKYDEFIKVIVDELKKHYGDYISIEVRKVLKNNGQYYDGLHITFDANNRITPIINLHHVYDMYSNSGMDIRKCLDWICEVREKDTCDTVMKEFVNTVSNWDSVKDFVYPVLVNKKTNKDYLNEVAFTPFLDMVVTYRIRKNDDSNGEFSVKIGTAMLSGYGISLEQLHEQALSNLEKDSYQFQSIEECVKNMIPLIDLEESEVPINGCTGLYVLNNKSKLYGASAILNKELMKTLVGNKNYFAILSCVHEVVLIVDNDGMDREAINKIITEVMDTAINEEEQLMDHYYYYYGETGEVTLDE